MCDGFVWLEFLSMMSMGFFGLIASCFVLFNASTFLLFVADYKQLFHRKHKVVNFDDFSPSRGVALRVVPSEPLDKAHDE